MFAGVLPYYIFILLFIIIRRLDLIFSTIQDLLILIFSVNVEEYLVVRINKGISVNQVKIELKVKLHFYRQQHTFFYLI